MQNQCPKCKRLVPYELSHYMGSSAYACRWPSDEHTVNPTSPRA